MSYNDLSSFTISDYFNNFDDFDILVKISGEYVNIEELIGNYSFTILNDATDFVIKSYEEDDEKEFMIITNNAYGSTNQTFNVNIFGEAIINVIPIENIYLPLNYSKSIYLQDYILTNGEISYITLHFNDNFVFDIAYNSTISSYNIPSKDINILYEYFEEIGGVITFTSNNVESENELNINVESYILDTFLSDNETFNLLVGDFNPEIKNYLNDLYLNYDEKVIINVNDYFKYYDDVVISYTNNDNEIIIIESFGETTYNNQIFNVTFNNETIIINSKNKDLNNDKLKIVASNEFGQAEQEISFNIYKKTFFNSLFPNSESLDNMNKFYRIFGVMLVIGLLGIFLNYQNQQNKGIITPVIVLLMVFAFVFFVFINYIPLWIFLLIILITIVLVVGFFRRMMFGGE
jgi:hypothetical protein